MSSSREFEDARTWRSRPRAAASRARCGSRARRRSRIWWTEPTGFLREMLALGITTVECKSGYGLDRTNEIKLLRVYRTLAQSQPVRLISTFLGAHVVPPEHRVDRARYLTLLSNELIPEVAREGLAAFCDVFVDVSAFTVDEGRLILLAGRAAGLGLKLHADQLSSGGGAELAAELRATSADHLEAASDEGIAAMARAGVVAVSLPLASLYLRQRPMPARRFIQAGVPVAVATDFNPRFGAQLRPPARAHPRLHHAADDAGGSPQRRHQLRGSSVRARINGSATRGRQGRRFCADRRARRQSLALSLSSERLPRDGHRRKHEMGTNRLQAMMIGSQDDTQRHEEAIRRVRAESNAALARQTWPAWRGVGLLILRSSRRRMCTGLGAQPVSRG